jgi:hypothetical protein
LAAKHGGLGIQSPKVTHPGAYLSSLIGCHLNMQQTQISLASAGRCPTHIPYLKQSEQYFLTGINIAYAVVQQHSVEGGSAELLTPLADLLSGQAVKIQKQLNIHVSNNYFQQLYRDSTAEDRVRLDSCGMEGQVLVTTIPKDEYCTMESELFTERLCTRLGLSINYMQCGICDCGESYGSDGYHLQSGCKNSAKPKNRTHKKVVCALHSMGLEANLRCTMEDSSNFQILHPTTELRVDNAMECYEDRKPLLADVGIVDPRKLNTDTYATGEEREYTVEKAGMDYEQIKITKYSKVLDPSLVFEPFIIEALGRWSPRARVVFNNLVRRIEKLTGAPRRLIAAKWKGIICFAHQKTAAEGLRSRNNDQYPDYTRAQADREAFDWVQYGVCKT